MKEETDDRNKCNDRTERFVNASGCVSEEIFRRVPKRVFLTEKLQSFPYSYRLWVNEMKAEYRLCPNIMRTYASPLSPQRNFVCIM